ncbi:thiamine pyrophosphate-binding protein [Chloroflexota bacterium]
MAMVTGREALMQVFLDEGVEYVFGLPGTTELLFLDALEDHPEMKYILGLNEAVVAGIAQGYTRVSGKAGVINVHTCAGLAAAMPMLYNAYMGGEPLILTSGKQDSRMEMQEPHLAGDLAGIAGHFCKWSAEVYRAEDIPVAMQRAFKVALQPPTGPVFLSLPIDAMAQSFDFEFIPSKPLFKKVRPDRDAIAAAAELLLNAKKPAIYVEAGVSRNDASSEVVRLAELTGARVYHGWPGDADFPNRHPQFLGSIAMTPPPAIREMLQSVDVLVSIGAQLISPSSYAPKPLLTVNTRVIQIDDNPWQIAKNFPADAGIVGNIKVALAELNGALQSKLTPPAQEAAAARAKEVAGEKEGASKAFAEKDRQERDQVPISASRLVQELRDAIKPGTMVVAESPLCGQYLSRIMDYSEPLSMVNGRGGGAIGMGIASALGAKLAAPDRPVVAVIGDGSAIWSIQSLWTAAHYNLAVTYVICDNASYGSLKVAKTRIMGEEARDRYLGLDFGEPVIDFCQMAQSMGIQGQKVARPDELGGALKTALAAGKPSLVDVCI